MKEKLLSVITIFIMLLGVSGCGKVGVKTVICESEKVGNSPEIIYYEVYEVKDNEIISFEKYNIRTFDAEYLKLVSLDETIDVYKKDKEIKIEKISDKQLKIIDTNPVNVFKNSKSDDMTKFIVDSMERSDFSLYKFTCEVK